MSDLGKYLELRQIENNEFHSNDMESLRIGLRNTGLLEVQDQIDKLNIHIETVESNVVHFKDVANRYAIKILLCETSLSIVMLYIIYSFINYVLS